MRLKPLVVSAVLVVASLSRAQDCTTYNTIGPPDFWVQSGNVNHATGSHVAMSTLSGSCSYANTVAQTGMPCASVCSGTASATIINDSGTYTHSSLLYSHNLGINTNTGGSQAPNGGAAIQCGATAAATVTALPIELCGHHQL
jgi:hypothetical protein